MRVLVTGASGHIGSFVARRLLRDGHEVVAGVRASSDLWRLDGDRSARSSSRRSTSRRSRHGPARSPRSGPTSSSTPPGRASRAASRDDPRHVAANVGGTLELVRQAGEAGVRAFVGLGSQAEYGPYDEPLREDLTPRPVSLYGIAKLCHGRR